MHADIGQLLSLRDGEPVAADIRAHVQDCERCQTRLGELRERQDGLRALAELEPPSAAWAAIRARAGQREQGLRRNRAVFIAGGLAASVLVLIGALVWFSMPPGAPVTASTRGAESAAPQARALEQLIARSNRLERQLASLDRDGSEARVMRVSTAATIVDLEDHIASIDARLDSRAVRSDASAARELWQSRVDLMQSLLAVRAAHSGIASL